MPDDVVIRVENASRLYKIGTRQQGYKTLRVQLPFAVAEREKRAARAHQRFEARLKRDNKLKKIVN